MRYIYVGLWWSFSLVLAYVLGTRDAPVIVATLPGPPPPVELIVATEPLPQVPCIDPRRDLGVRDGPELRTFLYALNPQVCFEYNLAAWKPGRLGLVAPNRRYYDLSDL